MDSSGSSHKAVDLSSDPPLADTHHRLSSQSVTSLTSSRPAPPSPAISRRASGLSRHSSRPPSGVSATPSSSRPPHSRPVSRPSSGFIQPTTPITTIAMTPVAATTTTTTTPVSRHSRLDPAATSDLEPIQLEPTPTQTPATTSPNPALIQIRDYGFAPSDPRFSGQGPLAPRANRPAVLARRLASSSSKPTSTSSSVANDDDSDDDDDDDDYEDVDDEADDDRIQLDVTQRMWEEVVDDGTNGWGGFKWGFGRAWGFGRFSGFASSMDTTPSAADFPSQGDLDRNFGAEDEDEAMEMETEMDGHGEAMSGDGEGDVDLDAEGEASLFPGVYRALYAFEPEGTAEMQLEEDQFVRVIGRGGGVGWAVVVKDGLQDTGIHALVPESYLEPVRLDGEDDDA